MKVLHSTVDLRGFFADLAGAGGRALLLDYDGTLAPFCVERDRAVPYHGVREALAAILHSGRCRIVIISGRRAEEVVPLVGLEPLPEIWGCHGWERRLPNGTVLAKPLSPDTSGALTKARQWAVSEGLWGRCEEKVGSLAVHWRGLDGAAIRAMRDRVSGGWVPYAGGTGLQLREFDGGLELRAKGMDKGEAVRTILSELPPGAAVAYAGDDETDEDAFRVLSGQGLGVLVRTDVRPTAAAVWVRPPEELLEFLDRWRWACEGRMPEDGPCVW
jgi:trehalose 6-phosphate phosphatase